MSDVKRAVVKRSPDEWRATVSRFERSGQGCREFCMTENLVPSTFWWWRRKLGRTGSAGAPVDAAVFVEATVSSRCVIGGSMRAELRALQRVRRRTGSRKSGPALNFLCGRLGIVRRIPDSDGAQTSPKPSQNTRIIACPIAGRTLASMAPMLTNSIARALAHFVYRFSRRWPPFFEQLGSEFKV